MSLLPENFMMDVTLSFHKVIDHYRARLQQDINPIVRDYINSLMKYVDDNPQLETGIDLDDFKNHEQAISFLLADLFPAALTLNEIKAATIPFSDVVFNKTQRFDNILQAAQSHETFSFLSGADFDYFKMACGVILNQCYGRTIDLTRPMHCKIPDAAGNMRTYRITYNADFVEVGIKDKSKKLSEKCIEKLLREPDNKELWEEKFPPKSYDFRGFGIVSLTDVTIDNAISDLKTLLLSAADEKTDNTDHVESIFRQMFNVNDLKAGFTVYNHEDQLFEAMLQGDANSYLLGDHKEKYCDMVLCKDSYEFLLDIFQPLVIPDVQHYLTTVHNDFLPKNLIQAGMSSAIFFPIQQQGKLLGVLELVSPTPYSLNTFNAEKLFSISEYLQAALARSEQEFNNRIKALIQTECTSIHTSVQWKFEKQARTILRGKGREQQESTSFKDIVFKDVYPLFGQIDIVGSSNARNKAVEKDLLEQLDRVNDIFAFAKAEQQLPIYDQIIYRLNQYKTNLINHGVNANTESDIVQILKKEVNPIMAHLDKLSPEIHKNIDHYHADLSKYDHVIYKNRDNYDATVQIVNEKTAAFLDRKQKEAQKIYPHFFERFKTDGVEHNIYVGESITPTNDFNPVYLYNLRLWQLQTMVEMENKFYQYQQDLPVKIEAASMILVFGNSLSIRYRIDEKRFDVDGAYNARYEVIKKRIDKAHIKHTQERITQKGKIAIIYTNKEAEKEYLRYIAFLQEKSYLTDEVELLELEDVQGVVGLKAIRVGVLYNFNNNNQQPVSYEDLVKVNSL